MNKGIWYVDGTKFKTLDKDIDTDILIVGGGLTGINLLYYLKDANYKITLIEGGKLLNSTTVKSTAKLTPLQQDLVVKIKNCYGIKRAKLYYDSQVDAINEVVNIIKNENIDCDLKKNDSYIFINDKQNEKKLTKTYNLYKEFGCDVNFCESLPININIYKAFVSHDSYVFHPVKYGYGIVNLVKDYKNINIYEDSRMVKFYRKGDFYKVLLNNGKVIKCKYLVIASNYPSFLFPYMFPFKVSLEESRVVISKHKDLSFNAINLDKDVTSIRFHNDNLIKIISSYNVGSSNIKQGVIGKSDVDYSYTNYDVITADSLPIVDILKDNLFIGTGYNTWGMTNSNLAARILRDLILDNGNKYYELTSIDKKKSLIRYFNILSDALCGIKNFVFSHILSRNSATIQVIHGKKFGVYCDNKGIKHYIRLTCTHMKCGLFFNVHDKTWCCPCHGSKFDIDGNIIKGPSTECVRRDI